MKAETGKPTMESLLAECRDLSEQLLDAVVKRLEPDMAPERALAKHWSHPDVVRAVTRIREL